MDLITAIPGNHHLTGEVTSASWEVEFLTGEWSAGASCRPGDEAIDCAIHGPTYFAPGGVPSPRASPQVGCCK